MQRIPLFSKRRLPSPEIQINVQRVSAENKLSNKKQEIKKSKAFAERFIKTDIPGFDELFEKGIPAGSSVLLAGGPGSGKTIFGLQTLYNKSKQGKKCLYITFEEDVKKLEQHMNDFGWKVNKNMVIKKFNPFDITNIVDAMIEKAKGELLIDIKPLLFDVNFEPDFIVIDSLSSIASAFINKEETYRIYIDQLFDLLRHKKATSFLIAETEQVPLRAFTKSGVEEFLADGLIVIYSIMQSNVRQSAIEVLKMRGAKHQKKIVAMQIADGGIIVFPEQAVYTDLQRD